MTSCVNSVSGIQCKIKIRVRKPRSVPKGHKTKKSALAAHRGFSKGEHWRTLKALSISKWNISRAVSKLMPLSPALPAFEGAVDEALYQEIDYLEKEDLLDSPGVFHALSSVHEMAMVYLQQVQTQPLTQPHMVSLLR